MNSFFASAAIWTNCLEAVSRTSSPAFAAVSVNLFTYLLDRFLENDKKFSIKGFFSKWDQFSSFLWIWSHLPWSYNTKQE